jgi:hypothetical protein
MSAKTETVSVSIRRRPADVYAYLAAIENFPQWSAFARSVRPDGEDWLFETPDGNVRIRFAPRNEFGVLDHHVTVNPDLTVYVPMRVVANGTEWSEVLFTIFRLPGMSDQEFDDDVGRVLADLRSLKRVLEDGA